ncbi:NYN domain-containing protein [Paenibacillus sp. MBLB4367]|uniref:NYN domain-containing protein n=1 Tax=Paenibacillus sp. MBLB4367 TaxID=3384767 RepID=UPI0039083B47
MEEVLIVDGYNIIGAWPDLQRMKDLDLEEARDKLIGLLSDYQAFSGMRVIVVFDAHQVPGLGGKYTQHKLKVMYTKEKETADELIERLVNEWMARRRRIYVATSDMTEQNVIFGKGALRVPARELLVKVNESRKEVRRSIDSGRQTRKNSVDDYLSEEAKSILEKWRRGK